MAEKRMGTFNPKVPTDPKELISWANGKRDEGHSVSEREVYLNLAYMLGHAWVEWDGAKKTLVSPRQKDGDPNAPVRMQINKIGALVERVIARLTKSAPFPECRPVSNEENDVGAAKFGSRALQSEMNRMHWESLLPRLYFWVMPSGWSFLKVSWDPEQGEIFGEDELGQVAEGQIAMEIVPALEVKIDPNARTWDEARWCVRSVNMTREAIYETYGVTQVEDDGYTVRDLAEDVQSLQDGKVDATKQDRRKVDRVAVHELWLRPGGRAKPEGMVMVWSGGTILEPPRPFPYQHGQLPFIPFSLLPGIGFAEGRSWVSDLRGMQRDYNDARSREATIRRTLVPKILAARGQIDANRLTSRVEVVDYNPTGPAPTWLMPDSRWMAQYEQAMQRSDMEMGDRAGQAEVSQGRAPAGAPAAAILALQEADESKLAISARELADGIERLGFQILMLVRQFWTEERMVRTWSETGKLEVHQFRGSDLPSQLDVHISSESMLPKSKSARAQLALDLWDRGILRDPASFIRLLEVPGIGFLQEEFDLDMRQADRENEAMAYGEPVKAEDWHNHQAHLASLNNFRKTSEYDSYPPEIKAIFDAHAREHYAWIQFQTTGQMPPGIAGGMLPGEAGGAGEPAPEGFGGGGGGPSYLDPMSGMPSDPLMVAAGMAPSSLSFNPPSSLSGAGPVPGMDRDSQAARQGS